MQKVASITPICKYAMNSNRNDILIPHFKMLTSVIDRNIVLLGEAWEQENYKDRFFKYPLEAEPLIEVLKKMFPKLEFYETKYEFGAKLFNQGLEILKDYDIVFRLDSDMFLTKKSWKRLLDFIQSEDYECYKLDFSKCSMNYYYDFNHGLKSASEFDPIAVNPIREYSRLLDYDGNTYIINWDDFILHHFRGWKRTGDKEWIEKGTPDFNASPGFEYADQMLKEYGDNGKWYKCPKEIINLLNNSHPPL